jgi:hypothetical protein
LPDRRGRGRPQIHRGDVVLIGGRNGHAGTGGCGDFRSRRSPSRRPSHEALLANLAGGQFV